MAKTKISITIDQDVAQQLSLIEKNEGTKQSTFVNKRLRAFFSRPGKKFSQYKLKEVA